MLQPSELRASIHTISLCQGLTLRDAVWHTLMLLSGVLQRSAWSISVEADVDVEKKIDCHASQHDNSNERRNCQEDKRRTEHKHQGQQLFSSVVHDVSFLKVKLSNQVATLPTLQSRRLVAFLIRVF